MSLSDSDLLDAVNEALTRRLAGDGYEEYSQRASRFRFTAVSTLYQMRTDLQAKVTAANGGNFGLAEPFED